MPKLATDLYAEVSPRRHWKGLQPVIPAYGDPEFDAGRRAWLAWWEFGRAMGFEGGADEPPSRTATPAPCSSATTMHICVPPNMTKPGAYRVFQAHTEWQEVMPGLQCRITELNSRDGYGHLEFRLTPAGSAP